MNKRNGNRGQTIPLIGLLFFLLTSFGALAIDMGYINYQQMRMQNAADNAALAGAQALITGGCPNEAAANTAAQNNAVTNGFGASSSVNVTADNPPKVTDGPYQNVNCAVSVMINIQKNSTWFLNWVGYAGMPITAQGVALLEQNNPGCMFLLTPGASTNFNGSTTTAPNCAILMNGTANFNGATVTAKQIGYAGVAPSGGTFPEAAPKPMLPVADPCPEIAGCAYLAANPPATGGCSDQTFSNTEAFPGCYQNLTISGVSTMAAGTYVVTNSLILDKATVTGSGVTIYMTAGASNISFNKANLNLSPPASGNAAGVLLYRDPAQTSPVNFNKCTCILSGLVYFPTTQSVNYNSAGASYAVLVFGSANLNGSLSYTLNGPAANASLIDNIVLVQ